MGALIILGWLAACLVMAAILYGALCLAGRSDQLLDDFADRLERGDEGVLPTVFHASRLTSEGQQNHG